MLRQSTIPTAEAQIFSDADSAEAFIADREERALVVKADGLAAGKGVTVCENKATALDAIRRLMRQKEFGDAGKKVIIEERLDGEEVSILAVTDGSTIVPLETFTRSQSGFR